MIVGRKRKKPTKVVKDQITDAVTTPQLETEEVVMEEPKEEKVIEVQITDAVTTPSVESKEEVLVTESVLEDSKEEIVMEQPKEDKKVFMMDISEFGVKADEAERFVKTAIRFYFENKDKKMVEESKLAELEKSLADVSTTNSDGKYEKVMERIKKFEDQIKNNQFVPKKVVLDFTKELKS
jgi:hypothetical protein